MYMLIHMIYISNYKTIQNMYVYNIQIFISDMDKILITEVSNPVTLTLHIIHIYIHIKPKETLKFNMYA